MRTDPDRLISFESVHHAIKAENVLAAAGIPAVMLPTPREISVSCGQCLLFSSVHEKRLLEIFRDRSIRWSKVFSRDETHKIYEKLADFGGDI